jgi:alpha-beta hydrolase superfamily lysophospholipase
MIAGSLLLIVGSQVLSLGLAARAYGVYFMDERDPVFDYLRERVRLEHGLLAGAVLILLGVVFGGVIVYRWAERGFGALSEARLAVLAASVMIVGIQVFFSSFLLSILGLRRRD